MINLLFSPLGSRADNSSIFSVAHFLTLSSCKSSRSLSFTYRYDPEEESYDRVSSHIYGGILRAQVSSSGLFTLWADTVAPKAYNIQVEPTVFGTTGVQLRYDEENSGIITQASVITVNNQLGIIEFDYEDNTLLYYRPGWTAAIGDTLEISYQILDGAGNRVEQQTTRIVH